MKVLHVRVQRFDPKTDKDPRFESYTVSVNEGARVLHVLHAIHDEIDPTLSYRYCCGSGQCGSCAVRVEGEPVLACMKEATDGITIAPLNLPVKKDLVVDLLPKIATIASLVPAQGEAMQLPTKAQIEEIKPLRDCIECLACVSVCPAMDVTSFLGPTAMRQEMRLALDPRDTGDRVPDAVRDGLFTCTSCQACFVACPKKIQIPGKAIENLRALAKRQGFTLPRHQEVAALIKKTGRSIPRTAPNRSLKRLVRSSNRTGRSRQPSGSLSAACTTCASSSPRSTRWRCCTGNGIRVIIPKEQVCCGSPLIRTGQLDYVDYLKET